jgi:hypothetical protein
MSAFIISLHTCGSPFVIFLQQKTDASCFVFPKEIGSVFPKEIGSAYFPREIGSAPRSDQLYLWIYWISQRSKASYFGLLSAEPANVRASFILLRQL